MKVSSRKKPPPQQQREETEEQGSPAAAEAMDAAAAAAVQEEAEAERRTVLVGVRADAESRALLTWVLVNVAAPLDRVVAVHVALPSAAAPLRASPRPGCWLPPSPSVHFVLYPCFACLLLAVW
jgi:hypothetical protein